MRTRIRKFLAGLGGVAVVMVAAAWSMVLANSVAEAVHLKFGLASDFPPGDAIYKRFGDIYTFWSFAGLAVAAGLSFTLLAWERRPPTWRTEVVFAILLAIVLPMSFVNYWSEDTYVSRSQQVWLNSAEALLAAICVLRLMRLRVETDAASVLRAMATFFLLAFGVFVPIVFSSLWLLNWEGAISRAASDSIAPGWVSALSAVAAFAVSVLQYRLAKEKQVEESESSKIIIAR